MRFEVVVSADAERDIEDIYRYIAVHDSVANANYVLAGIERAFVTLRSSPARGNHPKELVALGFEEYREVHFKPYRIIYRIEGRKVVLHCVVDGRRDMESLLRRRLLR